MSSFGEEGLSFEDLRRNPICWSDIYASAFVSQTLRAAPAGAAERRSVETSTSVCFFVIFFTTLNRTYMTEYNLLPCWPLIRVFIPLHILCSVLWTWGILVVVHSVCSCVKIEREQMSFTLKHQKLWLLENQMFGHDATLIASNLFILHIWAEVIRWWRQHAKISMSLLLFTPS